jgi:hypothetical protein
LDGGRWGCFLNFLKFVSPREDVGLSEAEAQVGYFYAAELTLGKVDLDSVLS